MTISARFDIRYPGFWLQTELELPGHGVSALFGPSGCGKTSVLRAIAGLDRHPGYLCINGKVWQDDAKGIFVPTHRRALGYVFQEASLLPHLSVRRNLEFGWKRTLAGERRIDLQHTLHLLGIEHLLERDPAHLSGGERQRVAIARALLTSPRLLLMDEPLAALDLARKREVLPYLERIHNELDIPIIYVSHAGEELARLADHLSLIEQGKIIASGPIVDIMSRLDLATVFADDAGVVIDGIALGFDEQYQLAKLQIGASEIHLPHRRLAAGTKLRCKILARDVSIAMARHPDSSILNQVAVTVIDVADTQSPAHVMLRLDAGGAFLLARITRQALDRLAIAPGIRAWAQFKAVAILSAS